MCSTQKKWLPRSVASGGRHGPWWRGAATLLVAKEGGKVPVPFGFGAHVWVDFCGRLQPAVRIQCRRRLRSARGLVRSPRVRHAQLQGVSARGRSHQPAQAQLDSTTAPVKKAEAKLLLERAAQARANQPQDQGGAEDHCSLQRHVLRHGAGMDEQHQQIRAILPPRLSITSPTRSWQTCSSKS